MAVAEGVQRTEHECWLSCSSRSSSSSSLRLPPLHVRRWLVAVAAHQQCNKQQTGQGSTTSVLRHVGWVDVPGRLLVANWAWQSLRRALLPSAGRAGTRVGAARHGY